MLPLPSILLLLLLGVLPGGSPPHPRVELSRIFDLPSGGQARFLVQSDAGGGRWICCSSSGQLSVGRGSVNLYFSDCAGRGLGRRRVEFPGRAPIPEGSARVAACWPRGHGAALGMGSAPTRGQLPSPGVAGAIPRWILLGFALTPPTDPGDHRTYLAEVAAPTLGEALLRRDAFLADGVGAVVGEGFNLLFYGELRPDFDSRGTLKALKLRQAVLNDAITDYRVTIDGTPVASMDAPCGVRRESAGGGWNLVEVSIPAGMLDRTDRPGKRLSIDWSTFQTDRSWHSLQLFFLPKCPGSQSPSQPSSRR